MLKTTEWRQRFRELCRELAAAENDETLLKTAKELVAWEAERPAISYREEELVLRISFDGVRFEEEIQHDAIARMTRYEQGYVINRLETLALFIWQRYYP